jgi:transposase
MLLDRIDDLTGKIDELTARIEQQIAPFAAQLDEVTGIGGVCARELIAEIGVDMAAFPTSRHLVAWARFAPRANTSAPKAKTATTGRGNPWLAGTCGRDRRRRRPHQHLPRRTLPAPGPTPRQATRHRRGRQRGPDHRLPPARRPQARYHDLGADFYQAHRNQQRYQPNLIRQLEQLTGQTVTLTPRPERPAA